MAFKKSHIFDRKIAPFFVLFIGKGTLKGRCRA
jgi:hypothetical protein